MDWHANLRLALKVNEKLPKPKYDITARVEFLNISIPNKFRIVPLHPKNPRLEKQEFISQNGKKIYWSDCATRFYTYFHDSNDLVIGDGVIFQKSEHHINSPWSRYWWLCQIQPRIPLENRQGWVFTTFRSTFERDKVVELFDEKYFWLFDHKNYFVYDGINQSKHQRLCDQMFRSINPSASRYGANFVYSNFGRQLRLSGAAWSQGPWHEECLIELVPEFGSDFFWATEKIVRPIASGMPFVIIGCPGFLKVLRKIGFKTFHPHIDESYDSILDHNDRIALAVNSFASFVKKPNNLSHIQNICDHNVEILRKIQSHSQWTRIWKKIRRFIEL